MHWWGCAACASKMRLDHITPEYIADGGAGSSFVGNAGPAGGAVGVVRSALNVTASTFHNNMADSEAGDVGRGGAVWAQASVASMHDCTFSNNHAAECAPQAV